MLNIAFSSPVNAALVSLVALAILFGSIDMLKAVLRRRQAQVALQKQAAEYAIANFDALKDVSKGVITKRSLEMSKFKVSAAEKEHIEILHGKVDAFGHVIQKTQTRTGVLYTFGLSQDDLVRLRDTSV